MSMYYCEDCQSPKDNDYHPMAATQLCSDCYQERLDRQEERAQLKKESGRDEKRYEDARMLAADMRSKL